MRQKPLNKAVREPRAAAQPKPKAAITKSTVVRNSISTIRYYAREVHGVEVDVEVTVKDDEGLRANMGGKSDEAT